MENERNDKNKQDESRLYVNFILSVKYSSASKKEGIEKQKMSDLRYGIIYVTSKFKYDAIEIQIQSQVMHQYFSSVHVWKTLKNFGQH